MSKMERVGSSAMKSLAAYADSDEEEEYSKRSDGEADSGLDDYGAQRLDSINRHRTLSTAEIAKAQLPEAPEGDDDDEDEESDGSDNSFKRTKSRHTDNDDDQDAKFRHSKLISDDFDDESDNSRLVEPPPPARPKAFHSPSPSSSRGSTPLMVKPPRSSAIGRQPSSQALVSYGAEDDDEYQTRKSMEAADQSQKPTTMASKLIEEENLPNLSSNEGSVGSRPNSERSQKSTNRSEEGTLDEIDVDELLERTLDGDGTPQSSVASPGDVISVESIQIPPPPAEKCSEELQATFNHHIQRKRRGYDFNAVIQARTDFRNPSIYEKLIEHCGIDEVGTNFPKEVYDPHGFKPTDYYEEMSKAQRIMMEKMEKGTEKDITKPKLPVPPSAAPPEEKKRKSKWDQ